MKTRTITALIVGLVGALALGGTAAGVGTGAGPEIRDPAGDANFVNGHDFFLGLEEGPDTRPASVDGADLRAIWFETAYDTVKERSATGKVTAVRFIPTGLRVNIRTQAPAMPTFGPTLTFRVPVRIAQCRLEFNAHVEGPASTPLDEPTQAAIWKWSGCPGGSAAITNEAFSLKSADNVLTMEYPFSALPYSSTELVLAPDVEVRPDVNPAVQPYLTWIVGPIFIDEAPALEAKFRIGSDVPANVNCLAAPAHPECGS